MECPQLVGCTPCHVLEQRQDYAHFYQKNEGQSSKIKNRGLAWSKRPEMRIYSPLIGLITTTFWNTKINKSIQCYTWGSREEFHTRMRGERVTCTIPGWNSLTDILILTSHLFPYPAIKHDIQIGWLYHHISAYTLAQRYQHTTDPTEETSMISRLYHLYSGKVYHFKDNIYPLIYPCGSMKSFTTCTGV